MCIMKAIRLLVRFGLVSILWGALSAAGAGMHASYSGQLQARSPSDNQGSVELEQFLFVQAPDWKNGRGIVLTWLPPTLERLCLGKTEKQCSIIDFCIRTTNRESSQCKNIGVNLARIPPYPPGTRPRRMLSTVLMYLEPKKFEQLQQFYASAPKASLERLSMSARVKARIRYTRKPDDDDFELLDVIAVPPF